MDSRAYKLAFDALQAGVIITSADKSKEVLYVNDAWVTITGYSKDDAVGTKGGSDAFVVESHRMP